MSTTYPPENGGGKMGYSVLESSERLSADIDSSTRGSEAPSVIVRNGDVLVALCFAKRSRRARSMNSFSVWPPSAARLRA